MDCYYIDFVIQRNILLQSCIAINSYDWVVVGRNRISDFKKTFKNIPRSGSLKVSTDLLLSGTYVLYYGLNQGQK